MYARFGLTSRDGGRTVLLGHGGRQWVQWWEAKSATRAFSGRAPVVVDEPDTLETKTVKYSGQRQAGTRLSPDRPNPYGPSGGDKSRYLFSVPKEFVAGREHKQSSGNTRSGAKLWDRFRRGDTGGQSRADDFTLQRGRSSVGRGNDRREVRDRRKAGPHDGRHDARSQPMTWDTPGADTRRVQPASVSQPVSNERMHFRGTKERGTREDVNRAEVHPSSRWKDSKTFDRPAQKKTAWSMNKHGDDAFDRIRHRISQYRGGKKLKSRIIPPKKREKRVFKKVIRKVALRNDMSVIELARHMAVRVGDLRKKLEELGEHLETDEDTVSVETAEVMVLEFGMEPVKFVPKVVDIERRVLPDDLSVFPRRPPVVSVMGHVDHGKTTLLDKLRGANVASSEAGGITQGIGAFVSKSNLETSELDDDRLSAVTFIDTPGHRAFTKMRRQGGQVTDVIVLVVAADDGIMPQTEEVLKLASETGTPVVVALTKIDKVDSVQKSKERIMDELASRGVVCEEYGGETQLVPISSVTGEGVDELRNAISLQAEIMDLRADNSGPGEAVVIDSRKLHGLGQTSDVLVRWGALRRGDFIVVDAEYGKIRMLLSQDGEQVVEAMPGYPVRVVGLKGMPSCGADLLVVESEQRAKEIVQRRRAVTQAKHQAQAFLEQEEMAMVERERQKAEEESSMEDEDGNETDAVSKEAEPSGPVPVPAILKTDTAGIINALESEMVSLPNDEVFLKIIREDVGPVTASDVELAAAIGATIFGFNVKAPAAVQQTAREKGVDIRTNSIIYRLVDDVVDVLSQKLTPEIKEEVVGKAECLQTFQLNGRTRRDTTTVAGVRVVDGELRHDLHFRVIRDGEVLGEVPAADSIRHFKKQVQEVSKGTECGVVLPKWSNFEEGDTILCIRKQVVPRRLVVSE